MKTKLFLSLILVFYSIFSSNLFAQTLDVSSCALSIKRSNGNGQSSSSPGYFPGYSQNNPVAANVVGTKYDTVLYAPATKTGDIILYWSSTTAIVNLPVITRAWTTPAGSTTATIASMSFGPPAPPVVSGQNYNVKYCFYNQNIPPQGTLTLEFANPQTNAPAFYCSYDLQSGASAPNPSFSCAPSITAQPVNQVLCGASTASFSITSSGTSSFQWQVSNDSLSWTNISNSGNYSNATTATLSISSPTTYSGKYYRVVLTGDAGCGSANSFAALLLSRPKPTAQFANATLCGTGTQSLAVNLTGTAPWSITYNNGGTPVTRTNITSTPYYISASGASTYIITAVSDAYCSNTTLTGNTATLTAAPTVTPSNASICYGSSSFNLSYTASGSPNQFSITAGLRAMPGFSEINNASLTASPVSISIPDTVSAGVYDFNIVVKNSTTGCTSQRMSFTVTVKAAPSVTASSNNYSICPASTANLSAVGAATYSWSPSTGLSAANISNPVFTAGSTTTFSVTGTGANGCSATGTVIITVKASPSIALSTYPSASICNGSQVAITASGANAYSWSGPSGYTASSNQIIVSPTANSTYTVTATGANGCTASSSQNITVTNGPSLTLTSNTSTCKGSIVPLIASGATSYVWTPVTDLYIDAAATIPYTGTSLATVYTKPNNSITYSVYGTTGSCSSSQSVTVTVSTPAITAPPTHVMYCATDLSGGSTNQLSFSFSSASAVTCKWEYNTTNTWPGTEVTSTNISHQYSRSETNTTSITSSTIRIKTPGVGAQYFRLTVTSGTCALYYYTQLVSLTGTPAFTVSSNQTICSGTVPAALVADGYATAGNSSPATTFTYKWQSSTDGTAYSDIASTNSLTYSPGALTQSTWYRWAITISSSNCAATYYSAAAKVTVATAITGNTVSVANACASGITVTGSAPSGGNGTYSYSWEYSTTSSSTGFSAVAGASSQSYTPAIPSATTWYRRLVTSGSCANSTSAAIAIYPPITGSQVSNGQTICSNGSLTALSVAPSGGQTGSSFTYQWKISNNAGATYTDSTGATSSSLTLPAFLGTRYYQVTVTKGACAVTSNASIITVNSLPVVTVTPGAASVCQYNSTNITAAGASSYSWSPSADLSSTSGTTVITTPTANRTYTVTGTDNNGCVGTTSAVITYVAAPADPSSLTITDKVICSTAGAYTLATSNPDGATYEWFTVPSNSVAPVTTASASGTYFMYRKSGTCYSQNYATLNLSVADVSKPSVAGSTLTYCAPATADLTALQPAAAANTIFEWHTAASDPGAGNLVASPAAIGDGTYYLYAYAADGNCYSAASNPVSVTINSTTAATISTAAVAVCAPSTVDLNNYNTTAGSNTYKWYTTNNPDAEYLVSVPEGVSQSGTYYLYATNSNGCTGSPSQGLTVTINSKPSAAVTSPAPVCSGASNTIAGLSDAIGTPVYAWEYSANGSTWQSLNNGGVYSGAGTNTLSISNTSGLSGNYYRFTVTSASSCSNTSAGAILLSEAAPAISSQPVNAATGSGYNASFSVNVTGNFSSSYQWQVSTNGGSSFSDLSSSAPYTGVNSSSLLVSSATPSLNNYQYRCVVTNSCNTLTSSAATLSIAACTPPAPSFTSSIAASVCMGNTVTYTTQSAQNNYEWSLPGTLGADYSISSGGTEVTSNSVTVNWLTPGIKTVSVNYKNSGGCSGVTAATSTTIIKASPVITGQPVSSQLIATGNRVQLGISASDASVYQWTKNGSDVTDSTRNEYAIDILTQTNGGTFSIKVSSFAGCITSGPSYQVTPAIVLYSKANGNINDPSNWGVNNDGSGSTPVDFSRNEHTFVLANRSAASTSASLVIAGTLDVKNGTCNITPGTRLTAGIITRSGSTGVIGGSATSSLELTGINSAGTSDLYFDQSGAGKNMLKDLTINNSTVNINNALDIAAANDPGTVLVNSGVLVSNGNLTLKSGANGTARIAAPPSNSAAYTAGGYINGEVTVERYIPANTNRAWRLIGIPTKGTQTIHQAWQENATAPLNGNWSTYTNPSPGYGTNLTSNQATAITTSGYDYKTPSNSLMYYDENADEYVPVPNTSMPIESTSAYLVYIRGDRTMTPSSSILQVTPTILRTKGTLYQGSQDLLNVQAGKFSLVGNPYASRINLKDLTRSGVDNSVDVWDPKLAGGYKIGAFQTLTLYNGEYIVSPGGGSYGPAGSVVNSIESGQAFFVRGTTGGGGGSIRFTEASKSTGSSSVQFRPVGAKGQVITSLYAVTSDGPQLADGTMSIYDDNYQNEVDADDAVKMENSSENFSILRNNTALAVEKRKQVEVTDTISYNMYWLKQMNYQFAIKLSGFSQSNLMAKLVDNFTGTVSPLNVSGTNTVNFTVTSAAGSSAANRFKLILYPAVVLPVTYTSVKAVMNNDVVNVEWKVNNQINVKQYEVEKSVDGTNFTAVFTQAVSSNNTAEQIFNWSDANPAAGFNYYRIKSVDIDGASKYSTVVKVMYNAKKAAVTLVSNPVINNSIKLQFSQQVKGTYMVTLTNMEGQLLYKQQVKHTGSNALYDIKIGAMPAGQYQLTIACPDASRQTKKLMIQQDK